MTKEQKIIAFIKNWLDSNIDDPTQDSIEEDSSNLKEYIEHFEYGSLNIEDYITGDNAWVIYVYGVDAILRLARVYL